MIGYCQKDKIFFTIGSITAFASLPENLDPNTYSLNHLNKKIVTGSFCGLPDFKELDQKLDEQHKQFHAAEHKVFNAFIKKIKKLPANTSRQKLAEYLPNLHEIRKSLDYSFFCGTTIFISLPTALILCSFVNFFDLHEQKLFALLWLIASIIFTLALSFFIQKNFLLKPKDYQLLIARKALKEALNYDQNNHRT